MRRAFELAELGLGAVSPNPLVGCIVLNDDEIIGEGFHERYGHAHAEVNAINNVEDPRKVKGSTVVVSLEPCSYHGKTPPCADLLIDRQVSKVIIANEDPNPRVAGKGISRLKDAGIEVTTGVLEKEGATVNRRFFTHFTKKRPYVILKWAETADGFIARKNYDSKWISDTYSRKMVHKWRAEEDAILVGTKTAHYDDPTLNVRDWPLEGSFQHQPKRIVIDKSLKLSPDLKLFNGDQLTLCFNNSKSEQNGNVDYIKVDNNRDLIPQVLEELNNRMIQSVIIEGGAQIFTSFINLGLWDEARIFRSSQEFGEGIAAPKIEGTLISENKLVNDTLTILHNQV